MNKKDYIALAAWLREAAEVAGLTAGQVDTLLFTLCELLAADSKLFDMKRFINAVHGG